MGASLCMPSVLSSLRMALMALTGYPDMSLQLNKKGTRGMGIELIGFTMPFSMFVYRDGKP